jgi:phosphoribosylformimino-5-aminoimidazole carboxamide ribotide isomerase
MLVIPALDLLGGRCVRLLKGAFDRVTEYSDDPVQVAAAHAEAGARRLHVVDLDASRGHGDNRALVERIVRSSGLEVEVAGGIRSLSNVAGWLEAGAAWVVMGTTAVREPEVLAQATQAHPGRVLAALDVASGRPATRGWTQAADTTADELLARWAELQLGGILFTSVDRDGTLLGPDLEGLAWVLSRTRHPVIYGGGLASIDDLRAVTAAGAAGAVVGKAIYEGRIELKEALQLQA